MVPSCTLFNCFCCKFSHCTNLTSSKGFLIIDVMIVKFLSIWRHNCNVMSSFHFFFVFHCTVSVDSYCSCWVVLLVKVSFYFLLPLLGSTIYLHHSISLRQPLLLTNYFLPSYPYLGTGFFAFVKMLFEMEPLLDLN